MTARLLGPTDEPEGTGALVAVHHGDYRQQERSVLADRRFREKVTSLGGRVTESGWLGSARPHRVLCREGHETSPAPANLARGQGLCRRCAGNDPEMAQRRFSAELMALGATPLWDTWAGVGKPHRIRCRAGHEIEVRPDGLAQLRNPCPVCAGRTVEALYSRFCTQVTQLGGVVLAAHWLGGNRGHQVRCAKGHVTRPRPDHVASGTGLCHLCKNRSWDVFYVVTNPNAAMLKFGITSGNPRPRLTDHAHDGFCQRDLLLRGLGGGGALEIERATKKALRVWGHRPARGQEYFDIGVRDSVFVAVGAALADFR